MQVSNNNAQAQQARAVGTSTAGNARPPKTFTPTPKRGGSGIVVFVIAAIAVLAAIVALAMFLLNPGSSGNSSSDVAVTKSLSASSASASSSSASSSSASASSSSKSASSASASSKSASSTSGAAAGTTTSTASGSSASSQPSTTTTQQQQTTTQQQDQTAQQQYTEPAAQPAAEPEPEPTPAPTGTDSSYVLADTSTRVYSKSELSNMSSYDLWIARNEIFARHGRGFNDPDLQEYFNGKSWYTRQYSPEEWDATQSLSGVESQNAALMLQVEEERHSEYL